MQVLALSWAGGGGVGGGFGLCCSYAGEVYEAEGAGHPHELQTPSTRDFHSSEEQQKQQAPLPGQSATGDRLSPLQSDKCLDNLT